MPPDDHTRSPYPTPNGSLPQWSLAGDPDPLDPLSQPAESQAPAPSSDTFATRYIRGELLGVGGMGRVTLAYDRKLERYVALKELRSDLAESDPLRTRLIHLIREARLTARLDHPGVVSIFDVGELDDGTLYYTMRVVRGQSLAAAMARSNPANAARSAPSSLPRDRLLRSLLAACDAVGFAHRLGIAHRDLKPGNIMVGEFGETQVVDWGLACDLGTPSTGVVGTPAYMSPEQARGEPIDARSDVWSLGAILHELITGHPPHSTSADTPADVVARAAAITTAAPELAPTRTPTHTPHELAAIARRALAPNPADRYHDAKELAEDLANHLDGRRVAAHTYTPWQLAVRLGKAWRGPLIATVVGLITLAIAIGLGYAEAERERSRAVDAEAAARRAESTARDALTEANANLASLLAEQALTLHREGARPEAEVLAAASLELISATDAPHSPTSPTARGILLAQDAATRPTLVADLPLPPHCADVALTPGPSIVCRAANTLTLWDLDPPRLRWRRSVTSVRTPVYVAPNLTDLTGLTDLTDLTDLTGPTDLSHRPHSTTTPGVIIASTDETFARIDATTGDLIDDHFRPFTANGAQSDGFLASAMWSPQNLHLIGPHGCHALIEACVGDVPMVATSGPLAPAHRAPSATPITIAWYALCTDGRLVSGHVTTADTHTATPHPAPDGHPTGLARAAAMAVLPDHSGLIVALHDGSVVRLDLPAAASTRPERPRRRYTLPSTLAPIREVLVSPDGRLAAIIGERSGVSLLDVDSGHWLSRLPLTDGRGARFIGPRDLLTVGHSWRRWHLPEPHPVVLAAGGGVTSIALSGRRFDLTLAIAADSHLQRWRWPTRSSLPTVTWSDGTLKGVTLSRDAAFAFAASVGTVGLHRVPMNTTSEVGLSSFGNTRARRVGRLVAPGPDGHDWLITLSYLPEVLATPLATNTPTGGVPGLPTELSVLGPGGFLAIHHDLTIAPGHHFAAVLSTYEQRARRLVASRDEVFVDRDLDVGEARALAIERDGDTLWTAGPTLDRWDLDTSHLIASIPLPPVARRPGQQAAGGDLAVELAVSDIAPDGRLWVAVGSLRGDTWLWAVDGASITFWAHFRDHTERVAALAFSDDVRLLVTGSWDDHVRIRSLLPPPSLTAVEAAWGLDLDAVLRR